MADSVKAQFGGGPGNARFCEGFPLFHREAESTNLNVDAEISKLSQQARDIL